VKKRAQLLEIGKAEVVADGTDVALIGLGTMFEMAERAKLLLEAKGLSVALINPRFIKPMDTAVIEEYARKCRVLCTFEDHVMLHGFGAGVIDHLHTAGSTPRSSASLGRMSLWNTGNRRPCGACMD
jgi:1-deoxy-D-xylulose-5-phosphate synthase